MIFAPGGGRPFAGVVPSVRGESDETMEPNGTTEETELTAPYYLTSSLGYQQQYIDNAEDELAEASEALRVASREFRAAELRNTIAVAGLEKAKLTLLSTQENIARWIADERKRLARQAAAEARAAELAAEKAEQEAAEAAARGDEEPTERDVTPDEAHAILKPTLDGDDDEGGVEEPESVRTLAGVELGNGLDTGFVVDVGGADW